MSCTGMWPNGNTYRPLQISLSSVIVDIQKFVIVKLDHVNCIKECWGIGGAHVSLCLSVECSWFLARTIWVLLPCSASLLP